MKSFVRVVILDELDRVLMLYEPKNGWVLPGGKIEPEESAHDAAKREVFEETGLTIEPKIIRYTVRDFESVLWSGYWFLATYYEGIPEIKEPKKCSKMKFFNQKDFEKKKMLLTDTYKTVRIAISVNREEKT